MTFAVGGVTSLAGALLARQTAQRLGLGPTMILGLIFTGLGSLLSPLAHGATTVALLLLVGNQLVTDPGYAVYEINAISLRQAITPDRLLGRVNGSIRFGGLGAMLLGALVGGVMGQTVGLRPTLVVGACGQALASLWLFFSPVRDLKAAPAPAGEMVVAAVGMAPAV